MPVPIIKKQKGSKVLQIYLLFSDAAMPSTTESQDSDGTLRTVYFTEADAKGIKRRRIGPDNHHRKKTYEEAALTILPSMAPSTGACVPNSR